MKASRRTVVGLILAATVLFVVGILLEKGSEDNHRDESVALAAENPAERAAESAGETGHSEAGETGHSEPDEKVLGINLESTPFVILAVIGSLLLAAMVWVGRAPWIFTLVALAMIAFAVFDIAEILHQLDRDEGWIAALAGLVAVLHLAAAVGSAQLRRGPVTP